MRTEKTRLNTRLAPRVAAKSKTVNFFFTQDDQQLKRKCAHRRNFWKTTRPEVSNEPLRWDAFESWRRKPKA